MYQKKKQQTSKTTGWITCPYPRCRFSRNDPNATICESCYRSLLTTPDLKIVGQNKTVKYFSRKKKTKQVGGSKKYFLIALVSLGLLSGGIFAYQVKVKASSPTAALKRSKGTILFGGEPCAQSFIQQKVAKEIEKLNPGLKFLYRKGDRNRDQVWKVINNNLDLGFTEQTIDKHFEFAKFRGVELFIENYADDIIAFVTHKGTKTRPLTVKKLEAIYEGKITNWKQLGGEDREITPILLKGKWRNPNGLRLDDGLNPNTIYADDPKEGKEYLYKTPGAIFYTSATLAAHDLNKLNVISIESNGKVISPVTEQGKTNLEAIYSGEYPLIRNLQIVVNNKIFTAPENKLTERQKGIKAFVRYLLSPEGQRLVEDRGFGAKHELDKDNENKFTILPWL